MNIVAAWTIPPLLNLTDLSSIGVDAYHDSGIEKVRFTISQGGKMIDQGNTPFSAMNTLTGVVQWTTPPYAPFNPQPGPFTVDAMVYAGDGSMMDLPTMNLFWSEPYPIIPATPGPLDIAIGSAMDGATIELHPGAYTLVTCKNNPNTRWISIECPGGVATISGPSNPRINYLRLGQGVTYDLGPGSLNFQGALLIDLGAKITDSRPFTGPLANHSIAAASGLYVTGATYDHTITGPGGAILCRGVSVMDCALRAFAGVQTILGCNDTNQDGNVGVLVEPILHPDTLMYGSPQSGVLVRGLTIRGRACYWLMQPNGGAIANSAFLDLDVAMTADTNANPQIQLAMNGVRFSGKFGGQPIQLRDDLPGWNPVDVKFLAGSILPAKQKSKPGVDMSLVKFEDLPPYVWPS